MINKIDWRLWESTEEAGNFPKLEAGPQIVRILTVEDVEDKRYIKFTFDIVGGKFDGLFKRQSESFKNGWPNQAIGYRSYKVNAYPFLKSFVTALEKSNDGYNFKKTGGDFKSFVGLRIVANFAYEQIPFLDDEGEIIETLKVREWRSIEALNAGKIKVFEDVKELSDDEKDSLPATVGPTNEQLENFHDPQPDTDDLPF